MLRIFMALLLACWLLPAVATGSSYTISGIAEKSKYKIEVEGDEATHTLRIGCEGADTICISGFSRFADRAEISVDVMLQLRYYKHMPDGREHLMLLMLFAKDRHLYQAMHLAANPDAVLMPQDTATTYTGKLEVEVNLAADHRYGDPREIFTWIETIYTPNRPSAEHFGQKWRFNPFAVLFIDKLLHNTADTRYLNKKYRVLTANGPQPLPRNVYYTYMTYGASKYVFLDKTWFKLEDKLLIPLSGCSI